MTAQKYIIWKIKHEEKSLKLYIHIRKNIIKYKSIYIFPTKKINCIISGFSDILLIFLKYNYEAAFQKIYISSIRKEE